MTYKKRDLTHAPIREAFRDAGGYWVDTAGDPKIGFDGLVVWRGTMYPVEVKSGPSERLTDAETKRKRELAEVGIEVFVVWDIEMLLRLVGATS